MTKADIVDRIRNTTGCSLSEAAEYLETLLECIKTALGNGRNVKISRFGNFEVNQKGARRGRNPQTGEDLTIGARRVVTFKLSKVLKVEINGSSK